MPRNASANIKGLDKPLTGMNLERTTVAAVLELSSLPALVSNR